ncbi:metallophosphoesterase family protein [Paragemmobacter straminiformis]|uniref:Metallophosphoesterase family protein n=1 Tax=Paragemmobacter straminiformis TaxID=2045119 RepID=A0A842I8X5_9RHOB|nr:metallophosphoesterase family protein [Gemmobacter straminiformis]MBC2836290.1 metallophosphoesterase family protein [Gemmobacter straminiformis]
MTLALISDIHGNLAALEAVFGQLDRLGIGDVLCLGDVGGYYPELDACADLLRARRIPCLMGNHDNYLATNTPCPRSDSANRCLDYQRRTARPDTFAWLRSLPHRHDLKGLSAVHAGWIDPIDETFAPSDAYFAGMPGEAFASGHTHVQFVWRGKDALYCNPGSVGQPRDGDPRAAFAIWESGTFHLHRIDYDIDRTEEAMRKAGFDAYFFQNLRIGSRIGGKIDTPPHV